MSMTVERHSSIGSERTFLSRRSVKKGKSSFGEYDVEPETLNVDKIRDALGDDVCTLCSSIQSEILIFFPPDVPPTI